MSRQQITRKSRILQILLIELLLSIQIKLYVPYFLATEFAQFLNHYSVHWMVREQRQLALNIKHLWQLSLDDSSYCQTICICCLCVCVRVVCVRFNRNFSAVVFPNFFLNFLNYLKQSQPDLKNEKRKNKKGLWLVSVTLDYTTKCFRT